MTPIHQLLNRIRWSKEFGRGRFELGYFDRVAGTIERIALRNLHFPKDRPLVFELVDQAGKLRCVPFHRIREVWKDGELIWHRPAKIP